MWTTDSVLAPTMRAYSFKQVVPMGQLLDRWYLA
jgi:hypothetical protein